MWQYQRTGMSRKRMQKTNQNTRVYVQKIQRMWNMKSVIIPEFIGTTGIVTQNLKKKLGNHTRKTFNRFTTKDSYTWNITHNTESTAM